MSEPIRPFANGTEYRDWRYVNCECCPLWPDNGGACDLDQAILEANFGDGTISPEIAARLGWQDEYALTRGWPCREKPAEGETEPVPLPEDRRMALLDAPRLL